MTKAKWRARRVETSCQKILELENFSIQISWRTGNSLQSAYLSLEGYTETATCMQDLGKPTAFLREKEETLCSEHPQLVF